MQFISVYYLFFLLIVAVFYWKITDKKKWVVLLAGSYLFYINMDMLSACILLFMTVMSYVCAIWMGKNMHRNICMVVGLASCLSVLGYFKYRGLALSFFATSDAADIWLPIGISFYTFQIIGYMADVYRGRIKPEKHIGYYAAYVVFFPQVVAGPIERTEHLLPQIKNSPVFQYEQVTYGLKRMALGYMKKLLIADYVSIYVDKVFGNVEKYHGFSFAVATGLFAIQIYCDFSGYSDIAIGTAKLFGVDLTENFRSPYFSESIKEFWERWHISLSTWLRDYVYIPLGGNRCAKWRQIANVIVVFLISGLWHGAGFHFLIWGLLNGILVLLMIKKKETSDSQLIKWRNIFLTFSLVCVCWMFFRVNDLTDAGYIIKHVFDGMRHPFSYLKNGFTSIGIGKNIFGGMAIRMCALMAIDYASIKTDVIVWICKRTAAVRWGIYAVVVALLVMSYTVEETQSFIYFYF